MRGLNEFGESYIPFPGDSGLRHRAAIAAEARDALRSVALVAAAPFGFETWHVDYAVGMIAEDADAGRMLRALPDVQVLVDRLLEDARVVAALADLRNVDERRER